MQPHARKKHDGSITHKNIQDKSIPVFPVQLEPRYINPLRAKFFRGNIHIYLHFVSFIHIVMTQVLKIIPQ